MDTQDLSWVCESTNSALTAAEIWWSPCVTFCCLSVDTWMRLFTTEMLSPSLALQSDKEQGSSKFRASGLLESASLALKVSLYAEEKNRLFTMSDLSSGACTMRALSLLNKEHKLWKWLSSGENSSKFYLWSRQSISWRELALQQPPSCGLLSQSFWNVSIITTSLFDPS